MTHTQEPTSATRHTRPFSASLEKRLLSYAAAGAVGLLATGQAAQAEIVVTRTDVTLTNGSLFIDINHEGVSDFGLKNGTNLGTHRYLVAYGVGAGQNAVEAPFSGCSYPPAALRVGAPIGLQDLFCRRSMAPLAAINRDGLVSGPWANIGSAFLGLRFEISGQIHYGWAALNVKTRVINHTPQISATLLGYAYETVAGEEIRAGQTESTFALRPATLGTLALGADGLDLWRRNSDKEDVPADTFHPL